MRAFVMSIVVWSVIAAGIVLLLPGGVQTPGCMRLINPSADCLARLAEANNYLWLTQTLPMLVFFASGYVSVGVLAVRRMRRRPGA